MSKVAQEVLDKIIQRIVDVAQPDQIILFGSAAREEMGLHSFDSAGHFLREDVGEEMAGHIRAWLLQTTRGSMVMDGVSPAPASAR